MSERVKKSSHGSRDRKGSIHDIRNLKLEEVSANDGNARDKNPRQDGTAGDGDGSELGRE